MTIPRNGNVARPLQRSHDMNALRRFPIGAEVLADGVHFRVWAPKRSQVDVVFEGDSTPSPVPLKPEPDGYFSGLARHARPGMRYRFRLDGDQLYPDPASRFQPEGPHGPSQIIHPLPFAWSDGGWPGVRLRGQVMYETHIGNTPPLDTEENWRIPGEAAVVLSPETGCNALDKNGLS
jgi:maltooligosyltrehalose trehalohydrolase